MRVYALRDSADKTKDLAYIFYYTKQDKWYIEIGDGISEWELPFILEHFVRNGQYTVDSHWSREFVRARIVPPDRQNLGTVLRDNHMDVYSEFALFCLSEGRCSQDDCFITPISLSQVPKHIFDRRAEYISSATKHEYSVLVTLNNGNVLLMDLQKAAERATIPKHLLTYLLKLSGFSIDCAGNSIFLTESVSMPSRMISEISQKLPFPAELLRQYASDQMISTSEAAGILECSRQNIDDLIKRKKLMPARQSEGERLFYYSDIRGYAER